MNSIVITSAVRTPIGKLGGSLSSLSAHELGAKVISESIRRSKIAPEDVSEVVMGQVLTAGAGQNPARQAAVGAGIPYQATAMGVNQICGSGLRAVVMAYQALLEDDHGVIIAGGQESMSQSPHALAMRKGTKLGNTQMVDTMIRDGLWDAFHDYHMGQTAENVARDWKISRTEQDEFAKRSQELASNASNKGYFHEEMIPITLQERKGEVLIHHDEDIREETTAEGLSRLRPVFQKEGGTVTAGNSSGLNDGAAALTLMRAESAQKRGISPLGRIVSWATTGVQPEYMGMGPVTATRKALQTAGWKLEELDLIEANEAFASQCCAVGRELQWDLNRVNVNGGAIALGHPIGAS
ncbi:MAG: acetyl-CoA C-acetyltransferase, partial [Verrucomicrobiota bacterium]